VRFPCPLFFVKVFVKSQIVIKSFLLYADPNKHLHTILNIRSNGFSRNSKFNFSSKRTCYTQDAVLGNWQKALTLITSFSHLSLPIFVIGDENIVIFNIRNFKAGLIKAKTALKWSSQGRWAVFSASDKYVARLALGHPGLIVLVSGDLKLQNYWVRESISRSLPLIAFSNSSSAFALNRTRLLSGFPVYFKAESSSSFVDKVLSVIFFYSSIVSKTPSFEVKSSVRVRDFYRFLDRTRSISGLKKRRFFYVRRKLSTR
jgi:hypothetical protein